MTTFYSSTFISIVLAFLVLMAQNGQPVEPAESVSKPNFSNTVQTESTGPYNKVKIEIFDNLTCQECSDLALNTLPKIRELNREIGNLELRLYFTPDINNEIFSVSALALKCAADQEVFWAMHEKVHKNKAELNKKIFRQFAKELEINDDAFMDCIEEEVHKKAVEDDIRHASNESIIFFPSLLVNGTKLIGNQPFENIRKVINNSLRDFNPESAQTKPKIPATEPQEVTEPPEENPPPTPDVELSI